MHITNGEYLKAYPNCLLQYIGLKSNTKYPRHTIKSRTMVKLKKFRVQSAKYKLDNEALVKLGLDPSCQFVWRNEIYNRLLYLESIQTIPGHIDTMSVHSNGITVTEICV